MPDPAAAVASAAALPRPAGRAVALRVGAVLLATLLLHAWVLDRARRELDFELPPPAPDAIQVELFRLPAQIAVASKPAPVRAAPAPRAITPPAPTAPAASAPVAVEPAPQPAPTAAEPAAQPSPLPESNDELLPSSTANALPQEAVASPLDAVLVSFPKVGRFVSDTTYIKGFLRVLGTTTIEWKIGADAYEASSVTLADDGRALLTLASRGDVRPDVGVAPLRYTEQRLSRAPQAVNFQWDQRKVTFSASSAEFPLQDGVQDQLSFMAQLALLAQAFPDRFQPGAPVALEVASTRNLRVYDFRVVAWETIRIGDGLGEALKLERVVAPGVRDARIELWLAPSLRWLPARTRTTLPSDEIIETVLREVKFE
jgi:hypothetical protein